VRAGTGRPPQPPDYEEQQAGLAALLQGWRDRGTQPDDEVPEKLVYPLDHAYTPAELGFAALKGADAAAAGVLATAAREARCDLHLALLTVEESGAAEYADSYGSRRGRWKEDEDAFEAGEVYDGSVTLSEWRRPDGGGETVLGAIPVKEAALTCRCPRCGELARFLADPGREAWVLKAAEANRRHVEETIKASHCDVDTATDRRGRPYSLVCTKNQASYERRAKQRAEDTENLRVLG